MTPITTNELIRLYKAKSITINPADLKNMPDLLLFWILNELKLINARAGSVPSANDNIVSPPSRKLQIGRAHV